MDEEERERRERRGRRGEKPPWRDEEPVMTTTVLDCAGYCCCCCCCCSVHCKSRSQAAEDRTSPVMRVMLPDRAPCGKSKCKRLHYGLITCSSSSLQPQHDVDGPRSEHAALQLLGHVLQNANKCPVGRPSLLVLRLLRSQQRQRRRGVRGVPQRSRALRPPPNAISASRRQSRRTLPLMLLHRHMSHGNVRSEEGRVHQGGTRDERSHAQAMQAL
jgi:hypothetical protein